MKFKPPIWHLTFGVLTVVLAAFLLAYNLASRHEFVMRLGHDTPVLSRLGPDPRVVNQESWQSVREGPVYFNLRAPSWFDHGTVTLEYKDEGYSLSGMGAQVGPGFAYHVVSRPSQEVPLADGWVRASYTFSFAGLHQPKNVKRFLLDLQPSRRTGGELLIRDLRVFVTQ